MNLFAKMIVKSNSLEVNKAKKFTTFKSRHCIVYYNTATNRTTVNSIHPAPIILHACIIYIVWALV